MVNTGIKRGRKKAILSLFIVLLTPVSFPAADADARGQEFYYAARMTDSSE